MTVAVVIPSWNSADYLSATVASAVGQTHPADELLVIDDGSTDHTSDVCNALDSQVTVLRKENGGVAAARNLGAHRTTAEWLLFLDSDDLLFPHALKSLLRTAAGHPECGVVYGRVLMRGRNPTETRLHGHPTAAGAAPHPARANFGRSVISTPGAVIVRRELWQRAGGFVPGYEPMEDRDLWVKCGLLSSFAFCDTVVLDKTFRDGSAHTQTARRIESGLRSQLALPEWSRARGLDAEALLGETAASCVNRAFKEAVFYGCTGLLPSLLVQARELNVQSIWVARAWIALQAHRLRGGGAHTST